MCEGGGGGGNLPFVSVYVTAFYSIARLLLSALYTVMVIANLVRVMGGELELTVMVILVQVTFNLGQRT